MNVYIRFISWIVQDSCVIGLRSYIIQSSIEDISVTNLGLCYELNNKIIITTRLRLTRARLLLNKNLYDEVIQHLYQHRRSVLDTMRG